MANPKENEVTLEDIHAAHKRIEGAVHRTPLEFSENLTEATGNQVWVKFENLQRTGSFKERGALNKLLSLSEEERERGVICASAGNHAQGVAYHASRLNIDVTIVMPLTSPLVKVSACHRYGARVILHGTSFDEAQTEAFRLLKEENRTLVHAFDDPLIVAGQGTVGVEILEQLPEVEAVVVSIGGGGLIGGVALAVKSLSDKVAVYGVEAARIAAMQASIDAGKLVELPARKTLADGIAVRNVSHLTFSLVQQYVDGITTVEEEEIASAVLQLMEQEKTVVEGSGAAALAGLMRKDLGLQDKKVALILSGGNIDVNILSRIIDRGLVKNGRLVRLNVRVPDVPGSLARITDRVADVRANVVEVHHNRVFAAGELGETDIEMTLETRGFDHINELTQLLEKAGCRVTTQV